MTTQRQSNPSQVSKILTSVAPEMKMNYQPEYGRHCEVCKKELVGMEAYNMRELCDVHLTEGWNLKEWELLLEKYYERGWLQECTCREKRYRFSGSDRKKEAQNLDEWSKARTLFVNRPLGAKVNNAFMSGPRGVSKTNLGRCILTEFVRQGCSAMECYMSTLLSKATNFKTKQIELFTKRVSGVKVLLLEDVHLPTYDDRNIAWLHDVLGFRFDNRKVTILNGNTGVEGWRERMLAGADDNFSKVRTNTLIDRLNPLIRFEMSGKSLRRAE